MTREINGNRHFSQEIDLQPVISMLSCLSFQGADSPTFLKIFSPGDLLDPVELRH